MLQYAIRLGRLALKDPSEFIDRVAGQIEMRRDRPPFDVPELSPGDWMDGLHRLLGGALPCSLCAPFPALWEQAHADLDQGGHVAGRGFDAGRSLAEAAYAAARHLEPPAVIETGVARGMTSRFVLEGLGGRGSLYSIDLPPNGEGWHGESRTAVPARLRENWHFMRGSSRRLLPDLVQDRAPLRLFIHDSLHTTKTVLFELRTVWPLLAPGGLALVDDVEDNSAFSRFTDEIGPAGEWVVAKEAERSGLIAAIVKR